VGILDSLDFTSVLARHMAGDMLWAYVLLALTTAPPLVPNSALLVTGGVMAAHGQLDITCVLLVVAGSALTGDLIIHRGGRAVRGPVLSRFYRRPRRRQMLDWAASRIKRYGVPFVVACRFLPSGRLIGGIAAGVVGYPARCYLFGAGIAEVVWATYSVGIGYLGGRATGSSLSAIGLGLGVSVVVATIGGLVQLTVGRRDAGGNGRSPLPSVAVRVHHAGLAAAGAQVALPGSAAPFTPAPAPASVPPAEPAVPEAGRPGRPEPSGPVPASPSDPPPPTSASAPTPAAGP
jgi:membrane protein DedA with SNARE-associated domain